MERKPDVDVAATSALLARVFGGTVPLSWHRTPDGSSTQVYRVLRRGEVFYLRIAEEADENLETDAAVHGLLRSRGVAVPGIVDVEAFNPRIGRSTMITGEVPGVPVAAIRDAGTAAAVVERAGEDLAALNRIPVDGFGFVRRHGGGPLRAEYADYPAFARSDLPRPWPGALAAVFTGAELAALDDLIRQECERPRVAATLSHGDFDVTHVFAADGRYSGIIDLGEMRGTEPLFDLAHFLLHDRETHPALLLPALLRGYRRGAQLPPDVDARLRAGAILLGLRQLCRWLGPPPRPAVAGRAARIRELLTAPPC